MSARSPYPLSSSGGSAYPEGRQDRAQPGISTSPPVGEAGRGEAPAASAKKRTRARKLRANSSPIERRLWRILFAFRTNGYHVRKQAPIGPYVVDMACHHARLVIEVDGDTHGTEAALQQDARRDAFLRSQGYTVLRISNSDVVRNPDGVFLAIEAALVGRLRNLRQTNPLPNPPHKGEGAHRGAGQDRAHAQAGTSPPVGEAGRGDDDAR